MPAQPTYEQLEKRVRDLEKTESEHQKAIKKLRRSREMLARTEQIARSGSWEWDIAADEVTWSEGLRRIFRIDPEARAPTWAEQQALHPPDDWRAFCESLAKAVEEAAVLVYPANPAGDPRFASTCPWMPGRMRKRPHNPPSCRQQAVKTSS